MHFAAKIEKDVKHKSTKKSDISLRRRKLKAEWFALIGKGLALETSASFSLHGGNLILIKLIMSDPKFRRTGRGPGNKGAAGPLPSFEEIFGKKRLLFGQKYLG